MILNILSSKFRIEFILSLELWTTICNNKQQLEYNFSFQPKLYFTTLCSVLQNQVNMARYYKNK